MGRFPMDEKPSCPKVTGLAWGRIEVDGLGSFRAAKLFPGGAREWDWRETGTSHDPGIQPADVVELIDRGAEEVILSKGVMERLRVCPQTLQLLKDRRIPVHVLQSELAVELYNELRERRRVGALIHSTCCPPQSPSMQSTTLSTEVLIYALDLFGVSVFALTGAPKASQKDMDVFGMMLMAAVVGIGGGTVRDLLLGIRPVFWVDRLEYILICVVIAVGVFFIAHRLPSRQRWLAWADAIGLATFSVVGTQVAIGAGAPSVVAVLMGIMTATFGGIMRDVLCAEIPLILQREIYAMAAAAGAIVYVLGLAATGNEPLCAVLAFCVAFAARAAGILFQLSLPRFTRRR